MKETAITTMKNDLRKVNIVEMEDFDDSCFVHDSESNRPFATVYYNPSTSQYDVFHAIPCNRDGRDLDDEKKIASGSRFQASNAVKELQCRLFGIGAVYDGPDTASGAGMNGICDMLRGISARGRSNN